MTKTSVAETLQKPARRLPWIISGVAGLALAAAAVIGGPSIAAQINPAPTPSATAVAADTASAPLTDDELSSIQQAADEQQATIAAEAKAAADAAAAQAAADQAAAAAAAKAASAKKSSSGAAASGPVKCPAGSSANSGDGGNDTSCFPDICFHITLPDPAHPECVTPFKP